MNLYSLPADCLANIFSFLEVEETEKSLEVDKIDKEKFIALQKILPNNTITRRIIIALTDAPFPNLPKARELAPFISDDHTKSFALWRLSSAYRSSHLKTALRIALSIPNDYLRARALYEICEEHLRHGNPKKAHRIALLIPICPAGDPLRKKILRRANG